MSLKFPGRHSVRVHADDLGVELWKTALILADQHRIEAAIPVARYVQQYLLLSVHREWRALKYECVYLHASETGSETKAIIRTWMTFYYHQRPHSALGGNPLALVHWQVVISTNPISRCND
jgi:hypothetical protein